MDAIFYTAALIAVVSSVMVVTQRNTIYSLLFAVLAILAIAVTYLVLSAPLLAALQVIIYAGAIMVLYVFVIMMLNLRERQEEARRRFYPAIGLVLGGILILELGYGLVSSLTGKGAFGEITGELGPKEIGRNLFTDYALGIELASLLLLVALVGAFYVGRREQKGGD